MKELFENAEVEIIVFDNTDIIVTSPGNHELEPAPACELQ